MNSDIKRRIDTARDVLVGKIPDPKSQVEQITLALIYRFMDYMDRQSEEWGGSARFFTDGYEKYAWSNLVNPQIGGYERLDLYTEALVRMTQNPHLPQLFRDIFKNAFLPYRDPETLRLFLTEIDGFPLDHTEDLGDSYEYLLSIMSSQGDAGQFRTPRHIIDFIVKCVDPRKDETILDPACGTAGFLVSAYLHIMEANARDGRPGGALTVDEKAALVNHFAGYDISPDMVRLSLVNMYFHGFQTPSVHEYDTLTSEERWGETFDVIMANPPFMTPKGGIKPHKRFSIQANRSEVLFVDYIMEHLAPSGRAGVIVPEGIIFQSSNAYKSLRKMLVEDHYLYAVISLPAGVFQPYSGVKTSILLMDRELARRTDEILFVKVESDGFDLGAQRRRITRNDLPEALEVVEAWNRHVADPSVPFAADPKRAHVVPKEKIAASGDFNLSGDRYREVAGTGKEKWPMVQLGDSRYFRIESGGTPDSANEDYWGGPVNWATLVDLPQSNLITELQATQRTLTDEGLRRSSATLLPSGSVLVSSRATIGRVAVNHVATATNQGFKNVVIVDRAKANHRFVAYMITRLTPQMDVLASGGTFKEISKTKFETLSIPLPPLEVQQQIVAEIDAWQKVIDGAKQVVANCKPTIPVEPAWPMVPLGQACAINERTLSEKAVSGLPQLCYIDIAGVENGTGRIDYSNLMPGSGAPSRARRAVKNDDVLVSTVRPYLKAFAILRAIPENTIASTGFAVLTCGDRLLPEYLYAFTFSDSFVAQITRNMEKGAYPSVTQSDVAAVCIPLPPLEVQEQIVAEMEEERKLVEANKRLIEIHEAKIKAKIAEVWGE